MVEKPRILALKRPKIDGKDNSQNKWEYQLVTYDSIPIGNLTIKRSRNKARNEIKADEGREKKTKR